MLILLICFMTYITYILLYELIFHRKSMKRTNVLKGNNVSIERILKMCKYTVITLSYSLVVEKSWSLATLE